MSRLTSLRPSRTTLLTGLLVASFALVIPIIYEAWRAARGQQATARQALREYADFAAQKFLREAEAMIYVSLTTRYAAVRSADGSDRAGTAAAADLARGTSAEAECRCRFVPEEAVYFDFPVSRGPVATHPAGVLAPERSAWLADTVRASIAADTVINPAFRILYARSANSGSEVVVYTVLRDGRGAASHVIGFASPTVAFAEPIMRKIVDSARLLPASLPAGRPADSVLSVELGSADGRVLLARGRPRGGAFRGTDRFDAMFGSATVAVELDPALESALYFGDGPKAHISLFLLALTIAGALAGLSVVLLRREQELTRRRSDFTSSVSHELRTPLAQILLCGETLQGGRARSAEDQRWATNVIVREARRLITMVENVLHVARAERQALTLAPEWLELAPVIGEILRDFAPLAEPRDVRWRVALQGQVVALVDRFALRQMLLNLLDNAVKYGPVGQEVSIVLQLDDGAAVVEVADEGPGIPAAERASVWEPYWRGRDAVARSETGAGLGLAVVRELVVGDSGTVRVADSDRGTRIVVTLPRAFSASQADSAEPTMPLETVADQPG